MRASGRTGTTTATGTQPSVQRNSGPAAGPVQRTEPQPQQCQTPNRSSHLLPDMVGSPMGQRISFEQQMGGVSENAYHQNFPQMQSHTAEQDSVNPMHESMNQQTATGGASSSTGQCGFRRPRTLYDYPSQEDYFVRTPNHEQDYVQQGSSYPTHIPPMPPWNMPVSYTHLTLPTKRIV